jgi:hypothetical protein
MMTTACISIRYAQCYLMDLEKTFIINNWKSYYFDRYRFLDPDVHTTKSKQA